MLVINSLNEPGEFSQKLRRGDSTRNSVVAITINITLTQTPTAAAP